MASALAILLFCCSLCTAQILNYVSNVDPKSCMDLLDNHAQYFDTLTMKCEKCGQNSTLQVSIQGKESKM